MRVTKLLVLVLGLVLGIFVTAQEDWEDTISGEYEGVAESEEIGDVPVTVSVSYSDGQITGTIQTERGLANLSGTLSENGYWYVTISAGDGQGTVQGALVEDGLFTGTWSMAGATGTIVLTKVN
ncbi:MAG: hypothetical protein H6510_01985 [Acidobacteria bacterium]|nr:hypothetical protein [Acidobacteriota bacterium]MCB9396562.1 hypothetical protein [Acidobacteriota bacterium]